MSNLTKGAAKLARKVTIDTKTMDRYRDEYEQHGDPDSFRHMLESIHVVDEHKVIDMALPDVREPID